MDKGVIKLQKVGIWTIYFSIYYIDPKDGRTKDGKFGIVRKYESAKPENIMQAIANSIYYSVEYAKDMISVDTRIKISKIEWSTNASMIEVTKSEFYGIAEKKYSMKIKIDDYYPSEDDLEISYKSEEIFEAMDCCICCGRKEGPYSDAKLVACKGCPELICQYCNLEELGCKMCHKEDDLSFESPPVNYTNRDIIKKIKDEYYSDVPFEGFRRYSPKEEKLVSKFIEGYRMGEWEDWDEFIKTLDKEEEYVEEGYIEEDPRLMPYSDEDDLPDMTPYDEHLYVYEPFMDLYPDNQWEDMDWRNRMDDVYRDWGKKRWLSGVAYNEDWDDDDEFPFDEEEIYDAEMTKDGKDYVSRKIATIMRDWKKTGKIGNSSPKDSKTAQRQAIAVAFSMAARKGFKGTKKAEEDLYYFDDITKKHGIISNKLLLGSLAVMLSIASIGNMMVKTAVNVKKLSSEDELVKSKVGCGCGCKKKGGCN